VWIAVASIAAALSAGGAAAQSVRFVRASAPGGGNGLSWGTAYNNLQTALTATAGNPSVTQLWIAAGNYKPAGAGGPRTATFQLRNNLALYGGFAGGESMLSQRDIAANPTILSGDLNDDDEVYTCCPWPAWLADNTYHVVSASGLGSSARLDGVTIRGGAATDSIAPHHRGGGVQCEASSITIDSCTFEQNFAMIGGGAASLTSTSNATVSSCTFNNNRVLDLQADGGGAVFIGSSNPTVTGCHFQDNVTVDTYGGAIRSLSASPFILNCVFHDNIAAASGGGAIQSTAGNPVIAGCAFQGNYARWAGSLYCVDGEARISDCHFVAGGGFTEVGAAASFSGGPHWLINCTFDRLGCEGGGALYNTNAALNIINCRFFGNTASIWGGGAIWNSDFQTNPSLQCVIINTIFSGNRTVGGGGAIGAAILHDSPNALSIYNSTFANNTSVANNDAAITALGGGQVNVHNSIAVHNAPVQVRALRGSTFNVTYSMIEGGFAGTGNIASASPGFADENGADNVLGTPDDDLRLISSSLCIDAARNADVPADIGDLDNDGDLGEPTPLDLSLNARFYDYAAAPNTGSGEPPVVDCGAYEFQPDCPADIDNSGAVDVDDLIAVILGWGCVNPPGPCPADVNASGMVDVDDLIVIILAWGPCSP
jgi:hypothetical protein